VRFDKPNRAEASSDRPRVMGRLAVRVMPDHERVAGLLLGAIIERPVRAALWRGLVIVVRVTERAFCAVLPDRPPLALPDPERVRTSAAHVGMGAPSRR
jgi:hypothetical protein